MGEETHQKIKRHETVAYKASVEIQQILHTKDSGIYYPRQFDSYEVVTNTLKTTYEELLILWREVARFREGFKLVGDHQIHLPNIFAKINGLPTDVDLYWRNFNFLLKDKESTILIKNIPFTMSKKMHQYPNLFMEDGSIDIDKVKELKNYRLNYLKSSVQKLILDKLKLLMTTEGFFTYPLKEDFKYRILNTILSLDPCYLEMIQNFDYPYCLPKVVIYSGDEGYFTQEDIIILGFLHLVGFDIVIFTPTGYNNIETGINPTFYDIHNLDHLKKIKNIHLEPQPKEKTNPFKKAFLWFFQSQ